MQHSLIADHLNVSRNRFYWFILPETLEKLGFSPLEAGKAIAWYLVSTPSWSY